MQARSLLDYMSSNDQVEVTAQVGRETVIGPNLVERLNELEQKLAAAMDQATSVQHANLVGEIQTILRGKGITPRSPEHVSAAEQQNPSLRVRVDAPSLVPQERTVAPADRDEVVKFAQAVQLLGVAAERFLPQTGNISVAAPDHRLDAIEAKLASLQEDFQMLLQHLGGSGLTRR